MRKRISTAHAYVRGEGLGPLLIRSIAGTGVVRLGAMAASFVVGVQLARMLGVEGYGYYGLALSIITIAGIPGELGLPRLVTREVAGASARDDLPQLFGVLRWARRTALMLSAVMAVAAIAGVYLVSAGRNSVLGMAVIAGAATIPLMAMSRIQGGAMQGLGEVVRGQIPSLLFRPVLLALFLLAAYLSSIPVGTAGAMALNSVTALAAFVLSTIWFSRSLPRRPPGANQVSQGRRWLASSIPLALTDGMRALQTELTTLVIGLVASASQLGLFRIAMITATLAATAITVVASVVMPMIASLHASGQPAKLQKLVTSSAWAQFTGVCLLSAPLLVAPRPLLSLVYGPEYVSAAHALQIVVIGQIINAAFGPSVGLLNMTHHERRVTRAMGFGLVANLATVLLFGKLWGATGGALAFVIGLLCWNVIAWLDSRRILSIETSVWARAGSHNGR
ncbi:MAG: flippase [Pseudomonadota bacterium]